MKTINSRFNEELQQQIEGTLPKGHVYQLGMPSEILLKAGVKDLPIELEANNLAKKASEIYRNEHPFDLAEIKDLPNAINDPIAVFNSTKPDGKKMILTELKDKSGYNFVIAMKVRPNPPSRTNRLEVNSIRSIYPKDRIADIKNMLKSDKLTAWVDKEKAAHFVSAQSTYRIAGGNEGGSTLNIINNFDKSKGWVNFSKIFSYITHKIFGK
jgi:hypothetical protein